MARLPLLAYIDEAGQRSATEASSNHFVMAAVILRPGASARATALLADLRGRLGRHPGHA